MEPHDFSEVKEFPCVFFGFVNQKGKPYIFLKHELRANESFVYWFEHSIRELAASRGEKGLVVYPLIFSDINSPFFSDKPRRSWLGFNFRQHLGVGDVPPISDTYLFAGVVLNNESYGWFMTSDFGCHDIEDNENMFVTHLAYSIWGLGEAYENVERVMNDILLERQAAAK